MNHVPEIENVNEKKPKKILRQASQQSDQTFTEIVKLFQKRVFKLAYGFFQNREDAMEVVQETFLKIYEKIDCYNESGHIQNWIYRISFNTCIDYYRKYKKKRTNAPALYRAMGDDISINENPESIMVQQRLKELIRHSILNLSRRQKMVLLLKHYSNLKYQEIAKILNISIGTVKSLHHRALNNLKKRVTPLVR